MMVLHLCASKMRARLAVLPRFLLPVYTAEKLRYQRTPLDRNIACASGKTGEPVHRAFFQKGDIISAKAYSF